MTPARRRAVRLVLMVAGIALTALYLFPVYWMIVSGFKTSAEIFASPPTFFPRAPTLESFRWIFENANVALYLVNSTIIAGSVSAITIVLGAVGGYALARLKTRLVDAALIFILMMQTFPEALLATPMFTLFKAVDLLNTQLAVILATTSKTLALALIVLRPVMRQIPRELEEAAWVDGYGVWGSFWRVVLPAARNGLIVVGVIAFIQAFGEFVYPLAFTTKSELHPATVGLYGFIGAEYADWHRVMAFATVFTLPVLVLFLILQQKIVSGLTAGAVK